MMIVLLISITIFFFAKVVVEGAGAAGLAAILAGQMTEFKDKK